ncbi:hypothetical protein [Neisseria gonorrhoeae]|uniref:hypothetical protein n=1 Tax=Neisseria gonorrhoeae TaxID=485 RepID=UPI00215D8DCB|nr:hypothetical protein [Neisseria gonorrhoeae]
MAVGAVAAYSTQTTQPFLVRVDNNGVTDVVTTLKTAEKTYGEVWINMVGAYVRYVKPMIGKPFGYYDAACCERPDYSSRICQTLQ